MGIFLNTESEKETRAHETHDVVDSPVPAVAGTGFTLLQKLLIILTPLLIYGGYHWYQNTQAGTTINTTITTNDDLENGLVLHYTFDGPDMNWASPSAEVRDLSSSSNHGDATNMDTKYVTAGRIGQGVAFNNTDAYINAGSAASLDNIATKTVSFWIKRNADQSTTGSALKKSSWYVEFDSSHRVTFTQQRTSYGVWRTASGVPRNQWVFVAITYDSSLTSNDPTFYINGVATTAVETNTPSGSIVSDGVGNLSIGGEDLSNSMTGSLDDVRIYNRTLTAGEIKRLYELGATTHINTTIAENDDLSNGLALHYTFDGPDTNWASSSADILDTSGSGNNGDFYNGLTPSFQLASGHTSAVSGKIGQGLSFNGGNYINAGRSNLVGATSVSFAAWVYTSSAILDGSTHVLIDDSGGTPGSANGLFVLLSDDGLPLTNGIWAMVDVATGGCMEVRINNVISSPRWYQITYTYNSNTSTSSLYVDGVKVTTTGGSSCTGSGGNFVPDTNADMYIGSTNNTISPFRGSLDDVRVYNRALSASEVKRLYEMGATTHINTTIDTNDDLENGLVGHWTFDGPKMAWSSTTAEVLDSSTSSIEGDMVNMDTSAATAGKIGQALRFSGTSGYVSVADTTAIRNLTALTISAWIKPKSIGNGSCGDDIIVHKNESCNVSTDGWLLMLSPGNVIEFQVGYTTVPNTDLLRRSETNAITLNEWQNIIVTWTGTSSASGVHIFRNGTEVSYATSQNGASNRQSETANLEIGSFAGESVFDGSIDDVRIYNRALSAAEVKRLYELGGQ